MLHDKLEFREWPKTPRLNRDMVLTEKIDGTNSAVIVIRDDQKASSTFDGTVGGEGKYVYVQTKVGNFIVAAQSRKRLIQPGKQSDNAGFAAWVRENARELAETLGEGWHFGEWYGQGIQGNPYKVNGKRFALFNVVRYGEIDFREWPTQVEVGSLRELMPQVHLVPRLYEGPFSQHQVMWTVDMLRRCGSQVSCDGSKAEGVIVFHKAAGHVYKVLCENDELPKGIVPKIEREADLG